MKTRLSITAILEGATGLALIVPGGVATVLLRASLDSACSQVGAQIAGTALLSLALVRWLSPQGNGASAILKAMVLYNAVVSVFKKNAWQFNS